MSHFTSSRRRVVAGLAALPLAEGGSPASAQVQRNATIAGSPAAGAAAESMFIQTGRGAVATTVREKLRHSVDVSVFDFMRPDQIADVEAYAGKLDVTAACQAALDAAWSSGRNCFFPAGVYGIATLMVPGSANFRARAFKIYGQGSGEIFARAFTGGTILHGIGDAPVIRYVQDVPNTGGGTLEICGFRFEGNSQGYIVELDALYSMSSFHDNTIYQAGTGGGAHFGLIATVEIYHNYAINKDWNESRRGANRTGIGFNIAPSINCGLAMLRKNTSRGWLTAYNVGNGMASAISCKLEHNECSVTHNGIIIAPATQKAIISSNYFEGGDGGTGIKNEGNYTTISDNLIFPGFGLLIDDSSDATVGTVITGNVLSAGSFPNTHLLEISSTGAGGGPTKIVTGNSFAFSGFGGSIHGVVGILIAGIDPRLEISGNYFMPRGPWTGGEGTTKILDRSTSSRSARGLARGNYGIGIVANGNQEFPALHQGMISLGVPEAELSDGAVSEGVLETGEGSWFELNVRRATRVTRFAPGGQEGRIVKVYVSNANATFVASDNLKLAGSADYAPGPRGAVLTFLLTGSAGGFPIAIECAGRVEF